MGTNNQIGNAFLVQRTEYEPRQTGVVRIEHPSEFEEGYDEGEYFESRNWLDSEEGLEALEALSSSHPEAYDKLAELSRKISQREYSQSLS